MKRKSVILCLFGGLSLIAFPTKADVQFLNQSRSVSASNDKGQSQSISAPGFGLFDEEARIAWQYPWDPEPRDLREYSAGASQTSLLTSPAILTRGEAHEMGPFYSYGQYEQQAVSDFHVVLALDSPGEFLLTGGLYARGDYGGTNGGWYEALVQLSDQTQTLFSAHQAGAPDWNQDPSNWPWLHFSEVLSLTAGTYTLDARASVDGWYIPDPPWGGCGGGGSASYGISLVAIPAPAVVPLILWGLSLVALLRKRVLP